ncbi:DUF930 domain-containing protein [Hansschlegelia quercus]|uniref:DUF930 domain-containing protein n=1 Tax=Hansschlegelia quercus TaxID=2528245 RepID=A0A4Q9GIX5_9HYPH|nr:DUF930 domain-containing protein [Hansschlegelia quercus]
MQKTAPVVRLTALVIYACLSAAPAVALDDALGTSLRRLDPENRLHQLCDIEMMRRIEAEHGPLHPDRLVMDAESPAVLRRDVLAGTGGAVRSGGQWYRLSFRCRASAERLQVLELSYKIGSAIPQARWGKG